MSSKKAKKTSSSAGSVSEIQVDVIFQARTASISNSDRVCSPQMLFLSGGDMRALALRPGSYISTKSDEAPAPMLFQVWPSSKGLAGKAILNRIWWPNFSTNSESRPARISGLLRHLRVVDCTRARFYIESPTAIQSTAAVSTTRLIYDNIQEFSDHVHAHLLDGSILVVGQRMGITWRTRPVVLTVVRLLSASSVGDALDVAAAATTETVEEAEVNEIVHCIQGSTLFSFTDREAHDETKEVQEEVNRHTVDDMRAVAAHGFGSYAKQVQSVLQTARLALSVSDADTSRSKANPLMRRLFQAPRGLLLHGPQGTGKTLLIHAAVQVLKKEYPSLKVFELPPSLLLKAYNGDAEKILAGIFRDARACDVSVVIIDDAHVLCRRRDDASSGGGSLEGSVEAQKRLLSCLLTLLDGSNASDSTLSRTFVLASSSRPNDIEQAMRRPGRLDVEVEIGVPTAVQRVEILNTLLHTMGLAVGTVGGPSVESKDLRTYDRRTLNRADVEAVARDAHGFVAADLLSGIKEASILASTKSNIIHSDSASTNDDDLTASLAKLSIDEASVDQTYAKLQEEQLHLTSSDLKQGMLKVTPSALQEAVAEVPTVHWSDIGGMENVKQALKEVVEWPLQYSHLYKQLQITPPQGVLLYGPPGCSKTLMAKALATESGMNFLSVRGPELLSKWLGESEKAVQTLFRRARAASPCIVFFDEIDSLASQRGSASAGVSDRVLAQLLSELDGITSHRSSSTDDDNFSQVILVAATNRPDVLDKALMRPGRIDRKVYVPPPDSLSRAAILEIEMAKMPVHSDVNIDNIVSATEGFSGAEVVAVTTEAAMLALDDSSPEVRWTHIHRALGDLKKQISPEMLSFYENLEF